MLIPLKDLVNKYDLEIKGVIQVGAHWAEEHDVFIQLGVNKIIYIEPCKESYEKMVRKIVPHIDEDMINKDGFGWYAMIPTPNTPIKKSVLFFKHACGSQEGEFDMYVAPFNQGQSNSLLKPQLHLQQHPEVQFTQTERVKVVTLDSLPFEKPDYNLLMMDVQGFEGEVLKGATETLKHIDIIYTEVNRGQTYEFNMEIDEMDAFLEPFGFERVETYWPSPSWSWGDACYISKALL